MGNVPLLFSTKQQVAMAVKASCKSVSVMAKSNKWVLQPLPKSLLDRTVLRRSFREGGSKKAR